MESTRFHSPQMRLSKPVLTVVIALFALSTLLLHAKFNHEEQIMVEMGSQWENLISSPLFDLNMSALCREDQKRYQRMNYDGLESLSDTKVQAFFAQVIQFPVQTACFTMKRVGTSYFHLCKEKKLRALYKTNQLKKHWISRSESLGMRITIYQYTVGSSQLCYSANETLLGRAKKHTPIKYWSEKLCLLKFMSRTEKKLLTLTFNWPS